MSQTTPEMPDHCWPVSHDMCPDPAGLDDDVLALAEGIAVNTLRTLTGHQVGGCPIVVRPSTRVPCEFGPAYRVTHTPLWPTVTCACGETLNHLTLPGPVGAVTQVRVGAEVLPETAYRVVGETLIRTDGLPWPVYQNPATATADFAVTYIPGYRVDEHGAIAAGVLACEIAKALENKPCSLPSGATTVVRTGVTIEVPRDAFGEGLTGLPVVDSFIRRWNPYGLKAPVGIVTLDL